MTGKLGNFFLIAGILLLIAFMAISDKSPARFIYFCFGDAILFGLAILLLRRSKADQPKSERFSLLRKLLGIKDNE